MFWTVSSASSKTSKTTDQLTPLLTIMSPRRLSAPVQGRSLKEDITPCLSVLWNFSRSSRPARKYLRSVILPPLTAEDVRVKPEDGDSLKGRLVSLMTNSSTGDISNMVAELLYALCKENVGRWVGSLSLSLL